MRNKSDEVFTLSRAQEDLASMAEAEDGGLGIAKVSTRCQPQAVAEWIPGVVEAADH